MELPYFEPEKDLTEHVWRLVADVLHLDVMSTGTYQSNKLPREIDSTPLEPSRAYLANSH